MMGDIGEGNTNRVGRGSGDICVQDFIRDVFLGILVFARVYRK